MEAVTDTRPEPISLCARCVREAPEAATWCPHCGAPRSSIATISPFESTFTAWASLGTGLASARPRGVILAGMWLLLLPLVVFGLGIAPRLALTGWPREDPYFPERLYALGVTGFCLFLLALLVRSTVRYARTRTPTPPGDPSAAASSAGGSPPSDQPRAR